MVSAFSDGAAGAKLSLALSRCCCVKEVPKLLLRLNLLEPIVTIRVIAHSGPLLPDEHLKITYFSHIFLRFAVAFQEYSEDLRFIGAK